MPTKALSLRQRRGIRYALSLRRGNRNGSTRRWRKLRAWHLANHPICVFCELAAVEVDHIRPVSQGGQELDPANLRSVCEQHHDELTANLKSTGRNELREGGAKKV